jgi:hypothetical protein
MKNVFVNSVLASLAFLSPLCLADSGAQTHGHLTVWQAALHLLQEPDHLAMLLGVIGVGVFLWRNKKDRSE